MGQSKMLDMLNNVHWGTSMIVPATPLLEYKFFQRPTTSLKPAL